MGYKACLNASKDRVAEGNVGRGDDGASVGKLFGAALAMKSGLEAQALISEMESLSAPLRRGQCVGDVIEDGRSFPVLRSGKADRFKLAGKNILRIPLKLIETFAGAM